MYRVLSYKEGLFPAEVPPLYTEGPFICREVPRNCKEGLLSVQRGLLSYVSDLYKDPLPSEMASCLRIGGSVLSQGPSLFSRYGASFQHVASFVTGFLLASFLLSFFWKMASGIGIPKWSLGPQVGPQKHTNLHL